MNAPQWNGDDERDCGPQQCEDCGIELYPEELKRGTCRRCAQDGLEADGDERL